MRFILAILIVFFSTNCFAFWTKGTDTAPEVQTFCKRVLDDGGTVVDIEYMDKMVKLLKQLGVWSNVKFLGDANFGVKLNGSGVTKFYDLSGNNNDATQGTVAAQPVWTANVQGGRYGIVFDGGNDFLILPNNTSWDFGSGGFHILQVYRPTAQSQQGLIAGSSDWWLGVMFHYQGTRNISLWASSNGTSWNLLNGDAAGNGIGTISLGLNTASLVEIGRNGNVWNSFINAVQDVSVSVAGTLVSKSQVKWLGVWGISSLWLNGSTHLYGIFNTALTTAQRTAIETFLNSYFSIY